MGYYPATCPDCGKKYMWRSYDLRTISRGRRCEACWKVETRDDVEHKTRVTDSTTKEDSMETVAIVTQAIVIVNGVATLEITDSMGRVFHSTLRALTPVERGAEA